MTNHKNLKKVIAVSSMAVATMGAGAMVNADNVRQQPVSSQKSSISTKVSTESQSVKSSSKVVLKSSQSSSTKASSQSSAKSSSSSKTSTSSKKNDTKTSSSSKADSKKDLAKKSSASSKKNAANVESAVKTLQDAANKYQNSSDATTQAYAQEAQQWLSNLGTFMNAQKNGWNGQKEIDNEINALKNDIKSNEDTLNASWFRGNDVTKEIIKDQINADKAMLAYLTGNTQETSATKNDAKETSSKKADQKVAAKKTTSAKKSANKTVSGKLLHETHVASATTKNAAKSTKVTKANSAKKSTMPQTGETNNAGVLAGIGALAIAAAGAFLFRKRG